MTSICVISADFDGCWDVLFDAMRQRVNGYCESNPNITVTYNDIVAPLLQFIRQKEQAYTKRVLMVGSARQSLELDVYNKVLCDDKYRAAEEEYFAHTGKRFRDLHEYDNSCFMQYEKFIENSECWELDKFLLADHQHSLKAGTAWDTEVPVKFRGNIQIKVDTLRAQIDHISKKYGTQKVHMIWMDDREDLIQGVIHHFTVAPIQSKFISLEVVLYPWTKGLLSNAVSFPQTVKVFGNLEKLRY